MFLIIEDGGNLWGNTWTAVGVIASILTFIIAWKVYEKANKMVLDRYLNEDIPLDVFEDVTFHKEYKSTHIDEPYHKIEIGQKNNVYIIKKKQLIIEGGTRKKIEKINWYRGTLQPLGGYANIVGDTYAGKFYVTSEPFDNKILAIRDLSQYTDVNEKYEIFKNNS